MPACTAMQAGCLLLVMKARGQRLNPCAGKKYSMNSIDRQVMRKNDTFSIKSGS